MSDPTPFDIDFKNKMAWVWTTLKYAQVLGYGIDHFEKLISDIFMAYN